jgi:hypothetical protein
VLFKHLISWKLSQEHRIKNLPARGKKAADLARKADLASNSGPWIRRMSLRAQIPDTRKSQSFLQSTELRCWRREVRCPSQTI